MRFHPFKNFTMSGTVGQERVIFFSGHVNWSKISLIVSLEGKMKITDKYVFFWHGIYSNWHPVQFITKDGILFNCSEQHMMYHKAMFFKDVDIAERILKEISPEQQKALGREVKGFNSVLWDGVNRNIVFEGVLNKFEQNPKLLSQLLIDGKGRNFVEASPYDKIWGVGLKETDPLIEDSKNWQGKNYLGIVLDKVYQTLSKK